MFGIKLRIIYFDIEWVKYQQNLTTIRKFARLLNVINYMMRIVNRHAIHLFGYKKLWT